MNLKGGEVVRGDRRLDERGATLLMLSVVVFVFLAASTLFASSQIVHANRVTAEYGKLQAMNASEAGIFAAFNRGQSVGPTDLALGEPHVSYEARTSEPVQPYWIASTGSATVSGYTYVARARAFVSDGRILLWEFE